LDYASQGKLFFFSPLLSITHKKIKINKPKFSRQINRDREREGKKYMHKEQQIQQQKSRNIEIRLKKKINIF